MFRLLKYLQKTYSFRSVSEKILCAVFSKMQRDVKRGKEGEEMR